MKLGWWGVEFWGTGVGVLELVVSSELRRREQARFLWHYLCKPLDAYTVRIVDVAVAVGEIKEVFDSGRFDLRFVVV